MSVLILFIGTTAFAQPGRISMQGQITSISQEGYGYRIMLDHGPYSYFVPFSAIGSRDLRLGTPVRLGGLLNGNLVNVDLVALPGEAYYTGEAVPFGSSGWMSGTVLNVNRHLGYVQIRDDTTGQTVNVDVRHMNTRRPVNVWGIRSGDRINVNGAWERAGVFDARRIEY